MKILKLIVGLLAAAKTGPKLKKVNRPC